MVFKFGLDKTARRLVWKPPETFFLHSGGFCATSSPKCVSFPETFTWSVVLTHLYHIQGVCPERWLLSLCPLPTSRCLENSFTERLSVHTIPTAIVPRQNQQDQTENGSKWDYIISVFIHSFIHFIIFCTIHHISIVHVGLVPPILGKSNIN